MKWIKSHLTSDEHDKPLIQSHQPLWNNGTEMPAHVSEFLTIGNDFPNYALYLTVGAKENTRYVFAGYYYSLVQMEDFLVDWAATPIYFR